ncbi:hypothetical protein PABG_03687 [Paracoccidioides brasiliensis Pb03]|nr:hypothetical protein PABG_03687 [Paracoccidioides brasiliensis Pb03]
MEYHARLNVTGSESATEFSDGKFNMPDEFEELERGVWETIFKGVSTALGDLKANIDTVQMSVNYP